jgi:hypothetical protein
LYRGPLRDLGSVVVLGDLAERTGIDLSHRGEDGVRLHFALDDSDTEAKLGASVEAAFQLIDVQVLEPRQSARRRPDPSCGRAQVDDKRPGAGAPLRLRRRSQ